MKLRYYMRGLGIGVIVTAILMGIALGGDKEKLTDAEIMARARDLGMVESSVLADIGKDKVPVSSQNTPSTEKDASKVEESQSGENQSDASLGDVAESKTQMEDNQDKIEKDDKTKTEETQTSESEESNNPDDEYITLVIGQGESSVSVSRSLEELGLVESAKDYDRYLCDNGYDKYIRVGTHKIKVGSTDEEIAAIISRKKK